MSVHFANGDGDIMCGVVGINTTSDFAQISCTNCMAILNARIESLTEESMEDVLKYGHQVIGVFDNEDPAGYLSYSVGRCVRGKPEFLTTGPLPLHVSQYMINKAATKMDEGLPVEHGYEFLPDTLIANYPVRVVRVDPERYPLYKIWDLFGRDPHITALQLVWPDIDGRFPGEEGYDTAQPIYPLLERGAL